MKKIDLADIRDIAQYEQRREAVRREIIELKKRRRVSVGSMVTFVFENRATVLFQIQEIMRAERIVHAAAIQHELDTYNQLLPEHHELAATMFIELRDAARIRAEITRFLGINTGAATYLLIGDERVPGRFAAGQSDERRISAVQYVRFHLNHAQCAAFSAADPPIHLVIDQPHYQHRTVIADAVRRELARDTADE